VLPLALRRLSLAPALPQAEEAAGPRLEVAEAGEEVVPQLAAMLAPAAPQLSVAEPTS
jgi:hypothetical protein